MSGRPLIGDDEFVLFAATACGEGQLTIAEFALMLSLHKLVVEGLRRGGARAGGRVSDRLLDAGEVSAA